MRYQLLEPVTTMCKLVLLTFFENGTKIRIKNNVIEFDDPDYLQGIYRKWNGSNRDDLSLLYISIIRLIQWYIIPSFDQINGEEIATDDQISSNQLNNAIRNMIPTMCNGLKRIQNTYSDGNVVFSLQFFINVLNDSFNNNFDLSKLPACISLNEENLIDYDKIKKLWSFDGFNRLCDLFNTCNNLHDSEKEYDKCAIQGYIKNIIVLLDSVDTEFIKLIVNNDR